MAADAPLTNHPIKDAGFQWYALYNLPDCRIGMLVIDGPSGFIQRHSRYPALPLLFDRLADDCVIFLDDAARQDEREIVEIWLRQFPRIGHEYLSNERGCSILRTAARGLRAVFHTNVTEGHHYPLTKKCMRRG